MNRIIEKMKMFSNTSQRKNILILGSNGMLGHDVYEKFRELSQLKDSNIGTVIGFDVQDGYDFTKQNTLMDYFNDSIPFAYCINCIAYTDTARAETTDKNMSYSLNALVPKFLASACARFGTKLIHVSTDYVFSEKSGHSENTMYTRTDTPFPVNLYGLHKLIGEQFIAQEFGGRVSEYAVLRTSWLYGAYRSKSFVHKFLRRAVDAVHNVGRVDMTSDEISVPTSTDCLVDIIVEMTRRDELDGICHAVPAMPSDSYDSGISRLDFAKTIIQIFKSNEYQAICSDDERTKLWDKINIEEFFNPVPVTGIQPHNSAMATSFKLPGPMLDFTVDSWDNYLKRFIMKHGQQIILDLNV